MFKRIDHTEVVVADLEREIGFYVQVLGFTVFQRQKVGAGPLAEIAYLTLGNTMVELMQVNGVVPGSSEEWRAGCRLIALEVDDMEQALAYLQTKGVTPTWGPVRMGGGSRAEIKDPEGLSIELRQW